RVVFIAALIAAVSLGSSRPALACSCGYSPEPCEAFYTHDAVFAGVVQSIEAGSKPYTRSVRLRVLEAFRGVDGAEVVITTGVGDGDCGYPFKVGSAYLVYAYRNNQGLGTGLCTRTRRLDDGDG